MIETPNHDEKHDRPYYRFTLDDLADGGPQRQAVEEWFETEVERLDRGYTWDDVLDELERTPWQTPDGQVVSLDLGTSTDDPVYKRLRRIGQTVRRDLKS